MVRFRKYLLSCWSLKDAYISPRVDGGLSGEGREPRVLQRVLGCTNVGNGEVSTNEVWSFSFFDTLGDWDGDATVCASVLDVGAKVVERGGYEISFVGTYPPNSRNMTGRRCERESLWAQTAGASRGRR